MEYVVFSRSSIKSAHNYFDLKHIPDECNNSQEEESK